MRGKYTPFDYFLGFAIVAVVLASLFFLIPARWTAPYKYAHQFHIPVSQVHWKEKPDYCDYLRSPLGTKGCHFEASLAAYNSAGELVAGEGAPLFRDDPDTKQSMVSYDHGASWHARGRNTGTTVTRVIVSWVKVGD